MVLIHVDDDGQFSAAINGPGKGKLIVCDFFAHWCGPCRHIAPVFEQFSSKYSAAVFLKIDVERCRMTSQMYQVSAMPTFIVLLNGQELGRIRGADANRLENLIMQSLPAAQASVRSEMAATDEERAWLSRLVEDRKKMEMYEDEINQTLALSLIPAEEITGKAKLANGVVDEFAVAKHLMVWFHDSFFKWVNTPDCSGCGEKCEGPAKAGTCTSDETADAAGRVEVYDCKRCNQEVRFPRYNNPAKLLETRQGRCGEWANCFALCCRSMGLETRWVNDSLDHVWVEIYSTRLGRWIHCDPCENVIDTPLMYSKGWGKKHAYVFGVAIDHVRDVTWRYALNHRAALGRRTRCRETVLRNFLNKLNKRLEDALPPERQQQLKLSYMRELVEFLSPKCQLRDGSQAQDHGRESGNVEWRLERGELGGAKPASDKVEGQPIKPTEGEKTAKCLVIQYSCVDDSYTRPNSGNEKCLGWDKMVTSAEGIFRKVETDWKKCYLARRPGSARGHISWKIDLSEVIAKKIEVRLGELTTYNSGRVLATACYGDTCTRITGPLVEELDGKGCEYLEVRVEFSGGDGDVAWQHAQLFRADMDGNKEESSMTIRVFFE